VFCSWGRAFWGLPGFVSDEFLPDDITLLISSHSWLYPLSLPLVASYHSTGLSCFLSKSRIAVDVSHLLRRQLFLRGVLCILGQSLTRRVRPYPSKVITSRRRLRRIARERLAWTSFIRGATSR
jgi:hypothetical protein